MLLGLDLHHFALFKDTVFGLDDAWFERLSRRGDYGSSFPLRRLSAFIGRGDSGKSAWLSALSFISDLVVHGAPAAASCVPGGFSDLITDGADRTMAFTLRFETDEALLRYSVRLAGDAFNRPYVRGERVDKKNFGEESVTLLEISDGRGRVLNGAGISEDAALSDTRRTALSIYGQLLSYGDLCWLFAQISRWFIAKIPREGFSSSTRRLAQGGHRHLSPSFDNVRNVLAFYEKTDEKRYRKLLCDLTDKIPGMKRIGDSFLDREESSGNRRLFALLLLLSDPKPRPLICLDHPDDGLYHEAVESLLGEMRDYSIRRRDSQIFLTTHNVVALESLSPDEVFLLERTSDTGVSVNAVGKNPLVRAMYDEGIGMGNLWYSGYFSADGEGKSFD